MEKCSSKMLAGIRNAPVIKPSGESVERLSMPLAKSQVPRIRPAAEMHECSARRVARGFMTPRLRGEISIARRLSGRPPDLAEFFSLLRIPSSSHVRPPYQAISGTLLFEPRWCADSRLAPDGTQRLAVAARGGRRDGGPCPSTSDGALCCSRPRAAPKRWYN
jgi:hypothetical protein